MPLLIFYMPLSSCSLVHKHGGLSSVLLIFQVYGTSIVLISRHEHKCGIFLVLFLEYLMEVHKLLVVQLLFKNRLHGINYCFAYACDFILLFLLKIYQLKNKLQKQQSLIFFLYFSTVNSFQRSIHIFYSSQFCIKLLKYYDNNIFALKILYLLLQVVFHILTLLHFVTELQCTHELLSTQVLSAQYLEY